MTLPDYVRIGLQNLWVGLLLVAVMDQIASILADDRATVRHRQQQAALNYMAAGIWLLASKSPWG